MAKQVKIIQISKYQSAKKAAQFIQSEKLRNIRLMRQYYPYDKNRSKRCRYAICLIVSKKQEVIGRQPKFVNASELIDPEIFFDGKKVVYLQNSVESVKSKD
jgi:hypothetical protein